MTIDNSEESDFVAEKDCLRLFNNLAFLCDENIEPVERIGEINYVTIEKVFLSICRRRGIIPILGDVTDEESIKFTSLVGYLSREILNITLDHIQPNDLVASNPITIYNLLEVLAACEIYLPGKSTDNLTNTSSKILSDEFAGLSISPPSPPQSSSPSFSLESKNWSSPTYSSLSDRSLFSSSSLSSHSCCSLVSKIITPPISKVLSPQSFDSCEKSLPSEKSAHSSRKSSKSVPPPSPDSACSKLRDIGINTEPTSDSVSKSSSLTPESLDSLTMLSSPKNPIIPTKVDKCTNTEPLHSKSDVQDEIFKQCHRKFESYEELAAHRFALEVGQKIQRALKLEEATKHIEAKLSAITGDLKVNVSSKRKPYNERKLSKSLPGKTKIINKKIKRQQINSASARSNIYTKPLVSKDFTHNLSTSKQSQRIKPRAYSKLRIADSGKLLFDEWRQQEDALTRIQSDLKCFVSSDPNALKLKKIQERALIRDVRIERARVHKLVEDMERRTCSKYLTAQAKEEHLVKSQAKEKMKSFKEDLISYKNMIKTEMEKEEIKRKRLLDAFQTYYEQQLALIKEKVDQEEKNFGQRFKNQNVIYDKFRRQLKLNLEKEIGKVISSK